VNQPTIPKIEGLAPGVRPRGARLHVQGGGASGIRGLPAADPPAPEDETMAHDERIAWLALYASRIGARLELEGECGIGRECVGLLRDGVYPDYPEDAPVPIETAYHKHPCLAVLGRGERAVQDLYDWCTALEKDGFNKIAVAPNPRFRSEYADRGLAAIGMLLGKHQEVQLIRLTSPAPENEP